ncbi:MAG TPA: hypothetical protein VMV74_09950 [Bacteroidales bacterium]|nr:hypothetical protein [Bacteroidales bacterium]
MVSLTTAKHQIVEIDGVRCSLVESGINAERMTFLRDLLTLNKLEAKVREDAPAEGTNTVTYTIAVTDILFNPVYSIYERVLLRADGKVVTPAYWRQEAGDTTGEYWNYGKLEEADPYE